MKDENDIDNQMAEEDQGFIINRIEIKEQQIIHPKINLERPNDYQPRFIIGEQFLRKLPDQALETIHELNQQNYSKRQGHLTPRRKVKEQLLHPYSRYFSSSTFRLVYCRYSKEKLQLHTPNDNYSSTFIVKRGNDIKLSCLQSYSYENYGQLKNFERNKNNPYNHIKGQLEFDSKFQCGNLMLAYRNNLQLNSYVLFMQNDTNTNGYTRWFYFSVKNNKKNHKYQLSIVNFRKKISFFDDGLKPVVFSLKQHQLNGNGWNRNVENVRFEKSNLTFYDEPEVNEFYTLSFDISFPYENDITFISMGFPYSFSRLCQHLKASQAKQNTLINFNLSTIAYSIANNQVPYVTINHKNQQEINKKTILLLARQHPNETWSSYFMENIINELMLQSSEDTRQLLDSYIFKIFPMINVDGVIYGNARCDISGNDLNRNWKNPSKSLLPQVYAIKEEIDKIHQKYPIVCSIDLHGHSKEYGIFCYSCQNDIRTCRMLPYLMGQNMKMFDFSSCTYGISKYKESTARATIFRKIQNQNVLTIENSFYGYKENNKRLLFDPNCFKAAAQGLIKSLKAYFGEGKEKIQAFNYINNNLTSLLETKRSKIQSIIDSGSDSDPSCDQMNIQEKIEKIYPKNIVTELNPQQDKLPVIEKEQEKIKILKKKKKKEVLKIFGKNQFKTINFKESSSKRGNSTFYNDFYKRGTNDRSFQQRKPRRSTSNQVKQIKVIESPRVEISRQRKQQFKKIAKLDPIKNNYQSIQLKKHFQYLKGRLVEQQMKQNKKSIQTKYEFFYKYQEKKRQEELPLLCVLSDKKKQAQIDKFKQTDNSKQRSTIETFNNRYQPTLIINKKMETLEKLKDKQKNSHDLISEIWKGKKIEKSSEKHIFF